MAGRKTGKQRTNPQRATKAPEALWIYGRHAVIAALANPRRRARQLLVTTNAGRDLPPLPPGLTVETLPSPRTLDALLPPGAVHQGLALETAPLEPPGLDELLDGLGDAPAVVVILDQVTDPHNVGAILRSAAAFDAAAVITTGRQAAGESGALAKAACGGLDIVPYIPVVNLARALDRLAEAGFWRIGLAGESGTFLDQALDAPRVALVMGAEGSGLRRLTREHCDSLARLPMSGAMESLNVSNATAIALYEAARRQRS